MFPQWHFPSINIFVSFNAPKAGVCWRRSGCIPHLRGLSKVMLNANISGSEIAKRNRRAMPAPTNPATTLSTMSIT